jgi:hypothetical protein
MIHEIPARVHFLPDLKVGVSVTLCTPFVMISFFPRIKSQETQQQVAWKKCVPADFEATILKER